MSRDSASLLDIVKAGQRVLQFAEELTREQMECSGTLDSILVNLADCVSYV